MKRFLHIIVMCLLLAGVALLAGCAKSTEGPREDPFAAGVLRTIADKAKAQSEVQFLAGLADGFGWEPQVADHEPLKRAVLDKRFEEKVAPFLLTLFYKNGFSVLPLIGEGHQFQRDSVVRGAVGASRFYVSNSAAVRLIFLQKMSNVQIVHPKFGQQPQVFTADPEGVVSIRESLSEGFLR